MLHLALQVCLCGGFNQNSAADPSLQSFAGIAIYFYSPLWPFRVTTAVTLDSREHSLLDLRDYEVPFHQDGSETAGWQIVWSMDDLDNTAHVLNVSVGVGEDLAILDALVCVCFFLCVIIALNLSYQVHHPRGWRPRLCRLKHYPYSYQNGPYILSICHSFHNNNLDLNH